jgi:hypothetical protein
MPTRTPRGSRPSSRRRAVPVSTWIGGIGTVLLALLGLASGGVWSMAMMVAIVLLLTALYGVLLRRHTWLRLPRKRTAAALGAGVAFVVLIGSTAAFGATHPTLPSSGGPAAVVAAAPAHARAVPAPSRTSTPTPTPTPTPVVTTKTVTETSPVPFTSTTVESATTAKGTSSVTTAGVAGVETKTFTVTYTDGVETGRTLTGTAVTTPPVTQVTTVGTYVAPPPPPAPAPAAACTNGSYVNSAGATVCRPEVSSSAPSGATAKCGDGTYSFSQSRSGTCSRHGGVAAWL